ncbi:MAG TPA: alpha amylase [Herpetosiphon sp.]|uniref:Alpha-amylase n=1 Tax=Herpetosiphon aurantiacus (strain ATCC 23779 / DSM 785 / 114-95) TaxID=316274 RepID=A9B3N5_HERA2|nr:alpha-amylase family glycosyl hydrolase [Herpetosiphon sp.]ABX05607.1 alpha amylase catalytic region [Herpetosiphon aurantiacus DSM 785]HBW52155.1 alpha amylase [Herpetosiphon sp.]
MKKLLSGLLLAGVIVGCGGQATPTAVPATVTSQSTPTSQALNPTATAATVVDNSITPTPLPTKPTAPIFTADDERWAGRSIYFIMIDRFANGDPSNDNADGFGADRSDPRRWHGGDFRGIIERLDYIKGMGFGGIWITPVSKQNSTNAYHGYWQYDPYQIDPHFGTLEELRELVSEAHKRDILVMLDVVPNHMGDFLPGSKAAPPFDDPTWYHNKGNIQNYGNQQEVEDGDLLGLDDLDQDNPATRAELLKWIAWLKTETGLDGLRVDTAKHLPKDFLREFDQAANTFSLAEVFSSDAGYVAPYTEFNDAILDYPLHSAFKESLVGGRTLLVIQRVLENADQQYRNVHVNGTFLDNHDNERFLCLATGGPNADKTTQLRQALAVLYSLRGIPIVYYGTEQELNGCKDPFNREDAFELNATDVPVYQWISQLNQIRQAHPALQRGTLESRTTPSDAWAFQRTAGNDTVVVCINNTWKSLDLAVTGLTEIADGEVLTDALGSGQMSVKNGEMNCALQPKQVLIYTR